MFILTITDGIESRGRSGTVGRSGNGRHLLDATRAMAALLSAGLPLTRAITATSRIASAQMAAVLNVVRADVERGQPLADSLASQPATFPHHYVGLVRAGERGSDLSTAFARLAEQLERDDRLRSRILSAALYPLILAVAGGAALVVLTVVVLPRFAELLADTGTTLPPTTAAVLGASRFAQQYGLGLLFVVVALLAGALASTRTEAGQLRLASIIDRTPLIGNLVRELAAARLARITGTLLTGGATLLPSLDDAVLALSAPLTSAAVRRARARVREGSALHLALHDEPVVPPLLTQLVQLGEESGRLGEFLLRAADLFEERSERTLQRLITLAEPAMIVAFGGIVGFVALSLLQAIYSVNAGTFR